MATALDAAPTAPAGARTLPPSDLPTSDLPTGDLPTGDRPTSDRLRRSAVELLAAARRCLAEAVTTGDPVDPAAAADRYALAHLAALRTAAAVLAVRARPSRTRAGRPRPVWRVLAVVAPELAEWSTLFAAGAATLAAARAGVRAVSAREADDLLREAQAFLRTVEDLLPAAAPPVLVAQGDGG